MAWVTDYKPDNIKPNCVKEEGVYAVKVLKVEEGRTQDGPDGRNYYRVICMVNADGMPQVSIFLTEGPNFNADSTAFFDTFGINRGDFATTGWIGRRGNVYIALVKKGQYTNMSVRYLLDDKGYVDKAKAMYQHNAAASQQNGTPAAGMQRASEMKNSVPVSQMTDEQLSQAKQQASQQTEIVF